MAKLSVSKFAGNYFFRVGTRVGIIAVYEPQRSLLRIKSDCPEMGILKAVTLPYIWCLDRLTVFQDNIELGFAKSVDLDRCSKCVWATGHAALPCTVNPMSYGTQCRDYETK